MPLGSTNKINGLAPNTLLEPPCLTGSGSSEVEVEIVDLAEDPDTGERAVNRYSLADLELWPEKRLQDRLTLIAESLDRVWNSGLIKPRDRKGRRPDPDMPLFG